MAKHGQKRREPRTVLEIGFPSQYNSFPGAVHITFLQCIIICCRRNSNSWPSPPTGWLLCSVLLSSVTLTCHVPVSMLIFLFYRWTLLSATTVSCKTRVRASSLRPSPPFRATLKVLITLEQEITPHIWFSYLQSESAEAGQGIAHRKDVMVGYVCRVVVWII